MMISTLLLIVCWALCGDSGSVLAALENYEDKRQIGSRSGSGDEPQDRNTYVIIGAVCGGVGLILICLACCVLFVLVCKSRSRRRAFILADGTTPSQERLIHQEVQDRTKEADIERHNALLATNYFMNSSRGDDRRLTELKDMGSRVQKYWFQTTPNPRQSERQATPEQTYESSILTCSNAPISIHCPLLVDRKLDRESKNVLNKLVMKLSQNPYIHPIIEIGYLDDRKQVIIVQPFVMNGSLKDRIYRVTPNLDWAEKYPSLSRNTDDVYVKPDDTEDTSCFSKFCGNSNDIEEDTGCFPCRIRRARNSNVVQADDTHQVERSSASQSANGGSPSLNPSHHTTSGLPVNDVQKYGWQILKAMVFLYKQGFPVLGHVHSGNIFVQDGVCRLGGYENTLLGYRSRYYRMCQDHSDLEYMDVIMFGHLVFEMCCGYEFTTVTPTPQDYQAVRYLEGSEKIEEVLRYMFDLVTSNANGQDSQKLFSKEMVRKIKDHDFFRSGKENVQMKDKPENIGQRIVNGLRKQIPTTVGGEKVILDSSMKALLARVRQGVDSRAESEPVAKLYAQPQSVPRELLDLSNSQ